jgi:hypothetical protein
MKAAHVAIFSAANRKSGGRGFPVKYVGVVELHAAFLTESRTRVHVQRREQEIRGAPARTALEVK